MSSQSVATFNVGSSSLKFSLFEVAEDRTLGTVLLRGAVRDLHGKRTLDLEPSEDQAKLNALVNDAKDAISIIPALGKWLRSWKHGVELIGIGHRIVHGGETFEGPACANDAVLDHLDKLAVFAPAHQPHNLAGVRAFAESMPEVTQTLSFDTAFHRTMPRVAELYALPRRLSEEGILRFGFHGLSYAHIAETLPQLLGHMPKRVLALHIGSGASACAILDGESVATSMGLTALDGLPMATRSGDLDPGVVLHLIQDRCMSVEDVSNMLYKESGLLGVSGLSSDIRVLEESGTPEAAEAIELYCYRIAREAGSLAVAMEGVDAVVFSGGVGENAVNIRARIISKLNWLGLELDRAANCETGQFLSAPNARVPIIRVVADEERIIARDCISLL